MMTELCQRILDGQGMPAQLTISIVIFLKSKVTFKIDLVEVVYYLKLFQTGISFAI